MAKLLNPVFWCFMAAICFVPTVSAQTTEFTYQGSLKDGANLASGSYDFEFVLFDSLVGGSQIGSTLTRSTVTVTNGIFAVKLDFGSQFPGADRFLEIRVRQSGGGGLTTLTPRQLVNSAPYSVKSLNADSAATATNALNATNATNAANATTAGNFSGPLGGDVTGTQAATTVARLQGRNVSGTAPANGQVLKFNSGTNQWTPDTDLTGSGGGGTITGVTAGTGLTGGGTSGTVTVGIAPGGVGTTELAASAVTTAKLADANVTDAKIADVAGSKITGSITTATIPGANVTGTVANATNATTAINFSGALAGAMTGTQNATILANNAVTTAKIADSAVTSAKIAGGQVVKSVTVGGTTLTDNVVLAEGSNITITPTGNTLTIASTSGGVGGSGTASPSTVPLWIGGGTTLGDSLITQSGSDILMPNRVVLAAGAQGNNITFGSPSGETGITIAGVNGRADLRFGGGTPSTTILKLVVGPAGGPPPATNGIVIDTAGNVGIGTPNTGGGKLGVVAVIGTAIAGTSSGNVGVLGISTGGNGSVGVFGQNANDSGYAGRFDGHVIVFGKLYVTGTLSVDSLGVTGGTALCRNTANLIANCNASSLRYKTDLQPFAGGMNVINRLRPITFKWKADKSPDVGFGAEDVAAVEPLLTFRNDKGEIEGVKYDRLSVVFVNAIKEQQVQIAQQQIQIVTQQKQIATLRTANAAVNTRLRAVEKRLPKRRGSARRRH